MELVTSANNGVRSKRCMHSEETGCRLTDLPDAVIVHILSLLPTKDAVKMILVPKLRDLWPYVHTLSFEDNFYGQEDDTCYDDKFVNLVNHVVCLHESETLQKFCLRMYLNYHNSKNSDIDYGDYAAEEQRMANAVDAWLRFATRKKVKVIELQTFGCMKEEEGYDYKLPTFVLDNDRLQKLKLVWCEIKARRQVHLGSLRKLSISHTVLRDEDLGQIISASPLLEKLTLRGCHGLTNLGFTNPSIKKLKVMQGSGERRLEINCPNIKSLYLSGWINVDLNNVSSLAYADVCFSCNMELARRNYDEIRELLGKLGHVKVLALCHLRILVFAIWNILKLPCPSFSWTRLELTIESSKWHFTGLSRLLKESVSLESLHLVIRPASYNVFQGKGSWLQGHDFDGDTYWKTLETTFESLKHHLKTVFICGSVLEPLVIQFVEFLLQNALVLENLVIDSKKKIPNYNQKDVTSDELFQISQNLLTFPWASTRATINFY